MIEGLVTKLLTPLSGGRRSDGLPKSHYCQLTRQRGVLQIEDNGSSSPLLTTSFQRHTMCLLAELKVQGPIVSKDCEVIPTILQNAQTPI